MLLSLLSKNSSIILILTILLTYFIPNFLSIDRIGNQWLYLSVVNIFGILLIYFKHQARFKLISFKNIYVLRWYLLFIFTGLVSLFVASNIIESIITLSQYYNCLIALYLLYYFLSEIKNPKNTVIAIFFGLLICEIYFSFSPILEDLLNKKPQFRSMAYKGLAANINITSFSLVFKLPILFYLISVTNKFYKKLILSILLIIVLFVTYILGTRGAFLGILISIIFYLLHIVLNLKNIKKNLPSLFLIIASIFLSVIFNLTLNSGKRNSSVLDRASSISISANDGSVNQRLRYYKHGLDQFLTTPLFGIGIGNWKLKSIEYDKENILGYTVPYHAHNDFIQILAEQGIFGFTFYLMVFISFMFLFYKNKLIQEDNFYVFVMASFFIYFLDSNLNFPIARPISVLQFLFLLAFVSLNQNVYESEK